MYLWGVHIGNSFFFFFFFFLKAIKARKSPHTIVCQETAQRRQQLNLEGMAGELLAVKGQISLGTAAAPGHQAVGLGLGVFDKVMFNVRASFHSREHANGLRPAHLVCVGDENVHGAVGGECGGEHHAVGRDPRHLTTVHD